MLCDLKKAYTYTQADMYKHVQFVDPHCMYTHTHAHVHTRPLMGSVSLHFVVIHTSLLLPGGRSQTWKKLEKNVKKILHFFPIQMTSDSESGTSSEIDMDEVNNWNKLA